MLSSFWMSLSQARCAWAYFHVFIIVFFFEPLNNVVWQENKETEARGMPCLWSLSQTYQRSQLGYFKLVEGFLLQPGVQILDVSGQ